MSYCDICAGSKKDRCSVVSNCAIGFSYFTT